MKRSVVSVLTILLLAACAKKDVSINNQAPNGKVAPDGFTYKTEKKITVDVRLLTNSNIPISNVPVNIFAFYNNSIGNKIGTAITNNSGSINYITSVPAYIDSFIIVTDYVGLLNNVKTYLVGNTISCTIGGINGMSGNVANTFDVKSSSSFENNIIKQKGNISTFDINGVKTNTVFSYLGTANTSGRPNYLETVNDVISTDLLNTISYCLPERSNLTKSVRGSSYLSSNATSNLVIQTQSDIWITFVHEYTNAKSSLGFYTYPTNNPPVTLADIKNVTFIFPNCSYTNSGGNLASGNKVKLGNFSAGTTIGFVLYANGWDAAKGGANVNTGVYAFFTDSYLNPETVASQQKHSVLLDYTDSITKKSLSLIAFDDGLRPSASDNDFNDVVFYASSNPSNAFSKDGVKPVDVPKDTDGDGVNDVLDAYPNDASRAYDTYYPSVSQYGTIAFEDNWPLKGDYDLNDLVVSYRYKLVSNAKNEVTEIYGDFAPIASGAHFENGFGVEFPFVSSLVSRVTGQRLQNNIIKLNGNNTESGQTNAVVIPFDGCRQLINNMEGGAFINTDLSFNKAKGDTSKIYIQLTTPQGNVDVSKFNPFLICNKKRSYEVHLPGYTPTSLADKTLFGTGNDASNISTGTYYVTKENYPYAINFADGFSYPIEQAAINTAYLHFFDWTMSGGKLFVDWYKNTSSGYRSDGNIYNK